MTQQAGARWAAVAPPAPVWPHSPPSAAWGTAPLSPPGAAPAPAPAALTADSSQLPAQGPGWGAAALQQPPLEQQGARLLKRQRPDQDQQQQQGWQQQGWQRQQGDEVGLAPAPRRRRLEPTSPQPQAPPLLPAQQLQHTFFSAPQQHQQSQAAQQPAPPPDIDLAPAVSDGPTDANSGGVDCIEAEQPLRKRLELGGSEVRLMLPTPLPRSIPLDLPPSAAWPQAPPCHPDSLAWAVVPWSPTAPLAELAGMPAASAGSGGAGSSAGGAGMGSPGQARRLGLRFDHERPLPGVDTPVAMSVVAAPSVLIEELPPQRGAAELGMDSAATGGYEAMEE